MSAKEISRFSKDVILFSNLSGGMISTLKSHTWLVAKKCNNDTAIPKYTTIVVMSLIIVAIGPVAVAGSIPNFSKIIEMYVEKNVWNIILRKIDDPITIPRSRCPQPKNTAAKRDIAKMNPRNDPIFISLNRYRLKEKFGSNAIILITSVWDWVPIASLR